MEKYFSRYQFTDRRIDGEGNRTNTAQVGVACLTLQLRNQFLHVIYSLVHPELYLNYLKSVRKRRGSHIYTSDNQLSEEYAHQNKDLLFSLKKGKERTI